MSTSTRRGTVLLGGIAAIAVVVGVGYAAIPEADGSITGCYRTKGGGDDDDGKKSELRIVSIAGDCKKNEAPLTWSQRGPAGAPGASVSNERLAPGDAACPNGGSRFTAAGGTVTHACNGGAGGSLAAITDLSGLACTNPGGRVGSVEVTTGYDNAIALTCTGPLRCNGNPAVAHSNGLGQSWLDCTALGVPGQASTYSRRLAEHASGYWSQEVTYRIVDCGGSSALDGFAHGYSAVWAYSGALAGRVSLSSGRPGTCPTPTDPAWG